jgi:hypothetical protein
MCPVAEDKTNTGRKADRDPDLDSDLNLQSKCLSRRRHFFRQDTAVAVIDWYNTSQCAELFICLQNYFYIMVMQLNSFDNLGHK